MVDTENTKLSSVPARIVDGTPGDVMRSAGVGIETHYKANDAKRPKTVVAEGPAAVDDARYEGVFGKCGKRGKRVKRTSE